MGKNGRAEGLYLKTATAEHFSHYRLNGKRTFRRLEAKVLTIATLRQV